MKNVYVIGFVMILMMSVLACTKEVEVIKEVEVEKIVTKEADPGQLVVYSGRKESLVGPIIDQFKEVTGIDVSVKYGKTGEIAATLLEEGKNSPADIFLLRIPGAWVLLLICLLLYQKILQDWFLIGPNHRKIFG